MPFRKWFVRVWDEGGPETGWIVTEEVVESLFPEDAAQLVAKGRVREVSSPQRDTTLYTRDRLHYEVSPYSETESVVGG